jgi:carbonic anhydrase
MGRRDQAQGSRLFRAFEQDPEAGADSRVPANEIVGLGPGELFVHRNIANLAPLFDTNFHSVLQYAVETLQVKHIIVCGHYGCGGVLAALREWSGLPLENWLAHVRLFIALTKTSWMPRPTKPRAGIACAS